MDEDLANTPADPSINRSDFTRGGRFVSQNTITLSRGMDSTRLLFMGDHFQQQPSEQDIFFDCLSPAEDSPREGRSATSRCKFDDPAAIREALERAANATQMLLKNFDNSGGWNRPCAVTLELTARLVDPKKSRVGCPLHGKPVTVQMPLEFNPQSGKMVSCQQKHPPPAGQKHRKESICQCRSQQRMGPAPRAPPQASSGKSASEHMRNCESQQLTERSAGTTYMGSCGDSTSQYYRCTNATCGHRYDRETREVISICYLPLPLPEPEPEPEPQPEPLPPLTPVEESLEDLEAGEGNKDHLKIYAPEAEQEYRTEESDDMLSSESEVPAPPPEDQPRTSKRYYMARPQNKEFSNCSPCRFDPSPIMDEDGNVFCPGNCGCCMCPWRKRSFAQNQEHVNVKVCRCVQRGTIFTKFEDREVCSQASYFDFCPCREKAEAKFLELYHAEMWSQPELTRGREIQLTEIKELLVPPNHPSQ
ncbi:hypothetical protein M5D96_000354 [Drosophila gunungcola]|uniref:Uncharacterized protein n=1 Tax=Drosophila gunungcola TaxID=103775 RepID=A0A9P9YWK6_9MUSC|nr:hypothetical protein M5D96_000354 [Drosophila gunungcola]